MFRDSNSVGWFPSETFYDTELNSEEEGPSRGLLRDYEPSDGPSFEALETVWHVCSGPAWSVYPAHGIIATPLIPPPPETVSWSVYSVKAGRPKMQLPRISIHLLVMLCPWKRLWWERPVVCGNGYFVSTENGHFPDRFQEHDFQIWEIETS